MRARILALLLVGVFVASPVGAAKIHFKDGSLISGKVEKADSESVEVVTSLGVRMTIPMESVSKIECDPGEIKKKESFILCLLSRLKSMLGLPMWQGVVSIATGALAIATFLSLRQTRKERDLRLNREITEKVYNPLHGDLGKIMKEAEKIELVSSWCWEEIRGKGSYLVCQIPKETWNKLEEFSVELRRYDDLRRKRWNSLNDVISGEIRNYKQKQEIKSYGFKFYATMGGKSSPITLYELIFWDETLDQYVDKKKKELGLLNSKEVEGHVETENSEGNNWSKEDFEKIDALVKHHIDKDSKLQELVAKSRSFWKSAESMRDALVQRMKSPKGI